MGAWGTSLYSNDTTCDIRGAYIGFLEKQMSNQESYDKMMEIYKMDYKNNYDEEPLFWYALAETQWKNGRLMLHVKTKAFEWIDKNGGLELWEENKKGGLGWKKTLEKLRIKLESEQPKEKKIRKPVVINHNLWEVGDVYAYHFHKDKSEKYGAKYGAFGKYILIQKIGEGEDQSGTGEVLMRVHVFDKIFDNIPTIKDIKGIRLLPLIYPYPTNGYRELRDMSCLLMSYKKNDYPKNYLTYLGNVSPFPNVIPNSYESLNSMCWSWIEGWSNYLNAWHGMEYEVIKDGVFKYINPIKEEQENLF